LAGYSLAITRLNERWLARQISDCHLPNPNNDHIILVISSLQHIPFKIEASALSPLIALPRGNKYWEGLGAAAKRTRQWSIPVAVNIVWVLVAFLFTIVDSFVDFNSFIIVPGDAGYSIAAVWTYLLPLVVGWLWVGSQLEANHLSKALDDAHKFESMVTATEPAIRSSTEHIDHVNADEKKTTPIFNYSRVFIWSQNAERILRLYREADSKEIPVPHEEGGGPGSPGDTAGPFAVVPPTARMHAGGSVNDHLLLEGQAAPKEPVFAVKVFWRVLAATLLALGLQWGTTGASILIHLMTPPKGMGCRAVTYIVYGITATIAFWLLLFSSTLAHLARRQSIHKKRSGLKRIVGCTATFTRWLGKFIAIINGLGILLSCIVQLGGVYDSCFCSSTIFGGNPNGLVCLLGPDIKASEVYGYWIGGTLMALGTSALYAFAIYIATPMG
jgi:hypothetical protein